MVLALAFTGPTEWYAQPRPNRRVRSAHRIGLGLSIARSIPRAPGREPTLSNALGGKLEARLGLPHGTQP